MSDDIKIKIKELAVKEGASEEVALSIAEKFYEDYYRPFGGATSYAAVDEQEKASEYAHHVNEESFKFQAIVGNIMCSPDMTSADQKSEAVKTAADEFKSRVNSMSMEDDDDEGEKSAWGVWGMVKDVLGGGKRQYSAEQRREMAKRGQARPDGSYPIKDVTDLKNAIRSWGRGGATAADKAHIVKRARALGATDVLPENWKIRELVVDEKMIKHEGGKWVVYNKDGSRKFGTYDTEAEAKRRLAQMEAHKDGFKIFVDNEGYYRWVSTSSNAFEDHDKELFTTIALEEAIEHADKSGERGPLLVYHVPSAEIGQCDYQALAGRFLIESGTFDDTPPGNKALDYYINSDEEHQVSIGFEYHDGDQLDGQYDWLRIKERSVCPPGMAANPWTSFKVIGESPVNEQKRAELVKIFGQDLANEMVTNAEAKTKELEGNGVRFKEKTEEETVLTAEEVSTMSAALEGLEDEKVKAMFQKAIKSASVKEETTAETPSTTETSTETPAPGFDNDQLRGLASLLTDLTAKVDALSSIDETVKELQAQVKELSKSDDEKMSDIIRPRWSFRPGDRPSESDKTVVKDEKADNILSDIFNNENVDPARVYVEDLLAGKVVR